MFAEGNFNEQHKGKLEEKKREIKVRDRVKTVQLRNSIHVYCVCGGIRVYVWCAACAHALLILCTLVLSLLPFFFVLFFRCF